MVQFKRVGQHFCFIVCHLRPNTRNMSRTARMLCGRQARRPSLALRSISPLFRAFPSSTTLKAFHSDQIKEPVPHRNAFCQKPIRATATPAPFKSLSIWRLPFWTCRTTWKRARINTLRCLVGCTAGDFSSLWMLQAYYPELGMGIIMATSSKSPYFPATSRDGQ